MPTTFNNDHDIFIGTLSTLLDEFEKGSQLFAAQWIWWLASIVGYTDVLIYYRQYKIFPSDYLASKEKDSQKPAIIDNNYDIPYVSLDNDKSVEDLNETRNQYPDVHSSRRSNLLSDLESPGRDTELESGLFDTVLRSCDRFVKQSQKERKQLTRILKSIKNRL
jgi:hypothetical protein